jgi:proteasome beta subunit
VTDTSIGPLQIGESVADASFLSVLELRGLDPRWEADGVSPITLTEATTVLALTWSDGVVMAGDRRATAGNYIAHSRVRKVYEADRHSAVAISGTAGMAVELIKLFRTELEHYEKIEGSTLSLDGKANFLARMIRGNLSMAFQGLVVIPLFCGYDKRQEKGRLFSYDVVGGRYDELNFATTGSGGAEARSFLKSVWNEDLTREQALGAAVEAIVAAAEEDSATGGLDLKRGILPNVLVVTADGVEEISDEDLAAIAQPILDGRP